MSVIQGGPGFPFFHSHVYMYFCTGLWSPVSLPVCDIPYGVKHMVDKVKSFFCFYYCWPCMLANLKHFAIDICS